MLPKHTAVELDIPKQMSFSSQQFVFHQTSITPERVQKLIRLNLLTKNIQMLAQLSCCTAALNYSCYLWGFNGYYCTTTKGTIIQASGGFPRNEKHGCEKFPFCVTQNHFNHTFPIDWVLVQRANSFPNCNTFSYNKWGFSFNRDFILEYDNTIITCCLFLGKNVLTLIFKADSLGHSHTCT